MLEEAAMILYHGSTRIVDAPAYGKGRVDNDFGQGFYLTDDIDLAAEWAAQSRSGGFVNSYKTPMSGLKVLDLTDGQHSVLEWMALLAKYRNVRLSSPIEKRGRAFLIDRYAADLSEYDIVIGHRADDSSFSYARAFLSNTITVEQLEAAMHLGNLGKQVVWKSERVFAQSRFLGAEPADGGLYYARRLRRDQKARMDYQKILEETADGTFLQDIMRKEAGLR